MAARVGTEQCVFGQLFVQSLKAVAPILVLFLVITALSNQGNYGYSKIRPIIND